MLHGARARAGDEVDRKRHHRGVRDAVHRDACFKGAPEGLLTFLGILRPKFYLAPKCSHQKTHFTDSDDMDTGFTQRK